MQAWWLSNEPRRKRDEVLAHTPDEVRNLTKLAGALDESDAGELLAKAEVLRELGNLGPAIHLLARLVAPRTEKTVSFLRELCERADTRIWVVESQLRY